MSYNIKNFAQTVTYTVNDSTANTNAVSLTLLGKSLPNYGTYFNQNFVWLMENFSSDSANPPPYAVQGQLWWDSTFKFLNVYDGSVWKTIYGNVATINANGTGTFGNLTTTNGLFWANGATALNNYSNTNVTSYLPTYTGTFGTLSSLKSASVTTSSGGQHIGYHTGAIGANTANSGAFTTVTTTSTIVSQDTVSAPTFNATTINATNMYATTIGNNGSSGTSLNAKQISNLNSDGSASSFKITNFAGLTRISSAGTTSNTLALQREAVTVQGQPSSTDYNIEFWSGTNGANLTAKVTGNTFVTYGPILPGSNASVNLGGSSSQYWNNVYAVNFLGTSTTAKYADLAEKYLPDADYEVGTVMMVGGTAEVTQHNGSKVRAIGVISKYPAYKMNADQIGGVYVALKGRVPVKVIGPVTKGQALIGTAHGLAVAQSDDSQWMFAISLEDYEENTIKLIEAVIL